MDMVSIVQRYQRDEIMPIWLGNSMPRYREEQDEIYTTSILGTLDILGMNKTAIELLKLCDGKHSFNDIHRLLKDNLGVDIEAPVLLNALYEFKNIGLIWFSDSRYKSGDIFAVGDSSYEHVSVFIRKNLIRIKLMQKHDGPICNQGQRLILLPALEDCYYEVLAIRSRLKDGTEQIFGFYEKSILKGAIIINFQSANEHAITAVVSGLVIEDYLNNLKRIKELFDMAIKEASYRKYRKARINIPISTNKNHAFYCNSYLVEFLKKIGFCLEGILKDEIIDNVDVQLWSLFL